MKKNITLKLDESFLRKCKHSAIEEGMSVSQWVESKLAEVILGKERLKRSKELALRYMKEGLKLGGSPIGRDLLHER